MKTIKLVALTVVCGIALALQGCAVSSTNEVVKPGEQKGGFLGLAKQADVLVTNQGTLKGLPTKVIIGSFKVGFVKDNKARATAKGGFFSNASAGHATATVHLKDLSNQDLQKITNDIYAQFVKSLQGRGFTVILPTELANEASYGALHGAAAASIEDGVVLNVAQDAVSTYVAPEGMKLVFFIGEKKAMFDLSTETINKMQALNESTGATVLAVDYLVNFVGAETHGGWVSSASVQVGQGIRIGAGSITVYNGKNKAPSVIKLGQPVYSEKEFCTIEKTTSTAAKAIGTAANVASALLGGGTSQAETYDFHAQVPAYTEAVIDVGVRTGEKLLDKMASLK